MARASKKTDRKQLKQARNSAARSEAPRDPPAARKTATINDIARLTGVSKKTVSRVINDSPSVHEETRAKVKAVIAEHEYIPNAMARGLAFRQSFLVGMIYDQPNPQYVVDMQQGILDALAHTGYQLVLRPCDRASPTFLQDMRTFIERQKLYGVVMPPSVSEDERLAQLLRDLNCRYVRIASVSLDQPGAMLVTNDHVGGREAAYHLADLGHRAIAHVCGSPTFRSAHERRRGFASGLKERGLTLAESEIYEGSYTFESGYVCGKQLIAARPRPTAVFVGNDEMAAGIYRAVRDAGLEIGRDLSVVGFDDSPIASRLWPTLTTIHLPIRNMGHIAADKLLHAAVSRPEVVPNLVVRESTSRPTTG